MTRRYRLRWAFLILLYAMPGAAEARQQGTRSDSALVRLETLVVTANRSTLPIASSTHAISVITRDAIAASTARNLGEALEQVSGVSFVDFDGTGADPQLMVRGFYGGGEAEYALLLVDGRPINALESGRIAWDAVPLAAIERIEIVRGPASAAWGDAALGAVINVITRGPSRGTRASVAGGSYGQVRASIDGAASIDTRGLTYFGNLTKQDGFRSHAERLTGALGLALDLERTASATTTLSTLHDWRDFETPGPLTMAELDADRTASSPFYRFDDTRDRRHRIRLDRHWSRGSAQWNAGLSAEYRHEDRTRTVALAPTFADTKDRVIGATRVDASAQAAWTGVARATDELLLGFDASAGRLSSLYHDVIVGPADAYLGATGARGDVHADGQGTRLSGAAFAAYALPLSSALRVSMGVRADWLDDDYDAEIPQAEATDAAHAAVSPRIGLNLRYLESERSTGHAWLSMSRSFKAPTLDQLFDQRRFPVPFPPFEIGFANTDLDPQHGTNIEAGLYQSLTVIPGRLLANLSAAAYQMDLRDELDFDIETLRYRNLRRSRHRGLETSLDVSAGATLSGWFRYTRQSATPREGEHEGRQLKAIPRNLLNAGIRANPAPGLQASLSSSSAWGTHIDDANTIALSGWTRWDARVGVETSAFIAWVGAINLFDADYSTTGYPDSADPGTIYYYPAAGRSLEIGISRAW